MSSDVMKQGYVKFQSKNIGIWKKRWLMLRSQTRSGPVRLEKYEDEGVALMCGKCRTFVLTDVLNVDRLPDSEKRHAIRIIIDQYETIQFSLDSEAEAKSWLKKIEGEIELAHDNRESFSVYVMKNPKLPTHGECTIEVTEENVRLLNHRDQEVAAWPLNKLRSYGVERNVFTIEAGRSCPTGEGKFAFESEEAQEIYDRIHSLTKSVAFSKKMNDMKINKDESSNANCHKTEKYVCSKSSASRDKPDDKKVKSIQELSKSAYARNNQENQYDEDDDVYSEVPPDGVRRN